MEIVDGTISYFEMDIVYHSQEQSCFCLVQTFQTRQDAVFSGIAISTLHGFRALLPLTSVCMVTLYRVGEGQQALLLHLSDEGEHVLCQSAGGVHSIQTEQHENYFVETISALLYLST